MSKQARWVGAKSADNTYYHAVWVECNTAPLTEADHVALGSPTERRREHLARGVIREGTAICGATLPAIIAGANGGHDWDRICREDMCGMCEILMDREDLFVDEVVE